jgi:hypothetical protein
MKVIDATISSLSFFFLLKFILTVSRTFLFIRLRFIPFPTFFHHFEFIFLSHTHSLLAAAAAGERVGGPRRLRLLLLLWPLHYYLIK